ncbi:hypothetical protein NCCP133_21040 [Cytobacillus sp. NCCP-133]|nr:hypothetical protein NCCP133_21040 [Cytobacillus sp. NCCP-133]
MLSQSIIEDVIAAALATGGDFAEVYLLRTVLQIIWPCRAGKLRAVYQAGIMGLAFAYSKAFKVFMPIQRMAQRKVC